MLAKHKKLVTMDTPTHGLSATPEQDPPVAPVGPVTTKFNIAVLDQFCGLFQ